MTLDEKVLENLAQARHYAERGDASTMNAHLNLATRYAGEVDQDLSAEIKEIEALGYTEAVPVELADARQYAERGDASTMNAHLNLATRYAEKVSQDVSTDREEIETLGYTAAVPVKLADARQYAERGDASPMETNLNLATRYAEKVDLNVSDEMSDIRALIPT